MAAWPELHLERLLGHLVAHDVDFVVIGGVAAVLHGSPRLTRDLDVCFATDPTNLEVLGGALIELHARPRGVEENVPFVPDGQTLRSDELPKLWTDAGPLDMRVRPAGCPRYDALRRRANRYEVGDFAVLVASIPDLMSMKRAAGRTKDLADIAELEIIERERRRARGEARP